MTVDSTDIIPILNIIPPKTYGDVENAKKALCERGWFPANRNLLLNPEIKTPVSELTSSPTGNPESVAESATQLEVNCEKRRGVLWSNLNHVEGYAATVTAEIVEIGLKNGGRAKRARMLEEGANLKEVLKEAKKITAGKMAANEEFFINGLLSIIREREKQQKGKEKKKNKIRRKKLNQCIRAMNSLRTLKPSQEDWKGEDFKIALKYYGAKLSGNKKAKEERLKDLLDGGTKSPVCSPCPSDEEEEEEEQEDEVVMDNDINSEENLSNCVLVHAAIYRVFYVIPFLL